MSVFKNAVEGRRVSSVVFVEDYLQIVFEDYVLSMFVWPEVLSGGKVFNSKSEGYADTLSRLINQRVIEAGASAEQLWLFLTGGQRLSMSLEAEDRDQTEAATLSGTKDGLFVVWN